MNYCWWKKPCPMKNGCVLHCRGASINSMRTRVQYRYLWMKRKMKRCGTMYIPEATRGILITWVQRYIYILYIHVYFPPHFFGSLEAGNPSQNDVTLQGNGGWCTIPPQTFSDFFGQISPDYPDLIFLPIVMVFRGKNKGVSPIVTFQKPAKISIISTEPPD